VLEERGAESKKFLKRVPAVNLCSERCSGETWDQAIINDTEEVNGCLMITTKKIGEDSKEAATGRVGGAITSWEK
jgi:hypothetical protein